MYCSQIWDRNTPRTADGGGVAELEDQRLRITVELVEFAVGVLLQVVRPADEGVAINATGLHVRAHLLLIHCEPI
jgi:hypothetical protein